MIVYDLTVCSICNQPFKLANGCSDSNYVYDLPDYGEYNSIGDYETSLGEKVLCPSCEKKLVDFVKNGFTLEEETPTFNDGYHIGYADGCSVTKEVYSDYNNGWNNGFDFGYSEGYDIGSNEGYDEGYKAKGSIATEIYNDCYEKGYEAGCDEGYDEGYDKGYQAGCDDTETKQSKGYQIIKDGIISSSNKIYANFLMEDSESMYMALYEKKGEIFTEVPRTRITLKKKIPIVPQTPQTIEKNKILIHKNGECVGYIQLDEDQMKELSLKVTDAQTFPNKFPVDLEKALDKAFQQREEFLDDFKEDLEDAFNQIFAFEKAFRLLEI